MASCLPTYTRRLYVDAIWLNLWADNCRYHGNRCKYGWRCQAQQPERLLYVTGAKGNTIFFFLSDLTSDTFLVYGSLLLIRVDKSLVFLTEYNCLEVLRRWLPSGQTILEKKNIGHFVSVQLVTVAHLHNVPPPINERGSP